MERGDGLESGRVTERGEQVFDPAVEDLAGGGKRLGITVNPKHLCSGLHEGGGVAAPAQGSVHHPARSLSGFEYFSEKNGSW
jgi:hypothetical protein